MSVPRDLAASGKRDRLVRLIPVAQSVGASGFPIELDGAPIELWAARDDMGGRERIAMAQESAPFDTRWFLPYGEAFDPETVDVPKNFALEHGGRRYDIVSASMMGRREGVEITTLARQG